ncbi:MAG: hypothetical protein ACR2FU_04235 [Streptosporangiaceae bacterium]
MSVPGGSRRSPAGAANHLTTAARSLNRAIRTWYGARPLHLLALLAAFALAGYALRAVIVAHQWRGFAVWFIVAIIGHDLLLFPLYSLADLSVRRLLPGRAAGGAAARPGPVASVPVINYIRVPAGFALLLFGVWFPLILGLSAVIYRRASRLGTDPYLWRWLAVTGVMFALSAACYALALRRASARVRRARPGAGPNRDGQSSVL